MAKKILLTVVFIIIVFVLGIFLENKIKTNLPQPLFDKRGEKTIVINNNRESVKVKRVIDGDTIELTDGRRVRYIGINAPEMTDKRKGVLCFAQMAKAENQKLVENKTIELQKDVSDKDKYDRLLRYVWVDGKMINLELIQNGFAKIATYPPDVKYKDLFLIAQKESKQIICNKI